MSQDANTILQIQLKQQGLHTTRPQFTNVLYGTVLQTDVSIAPILPHGATSPIPAGMMTVAVAALGDNYVTPPILYPTGVTPAVGTAVSVGFTPNGTPVCVTMYKFGVLPITNGGTGATTAAQALANLGAATSGSVAAETARAQAAESTLTTNLSAETTRAQGAEGTLTTNLSTETTRAQAAEFFITNMIIMGAY